MAAPHASNMTRSSSSDSSALSNINVAGMQDDDSGSERVPASTPPTSLNDSGSLNSVKRAAESLDVIEEEAGRRPKRARSGPSTYNLKTMFDAQETAGSSSSRNVSGLTGKTLVDDEDEDDGAFLGKKTGMEWEYAAPRKKHSPTKLQRRTSVKDKAKNAVSKVGSVLGKRRREVVEAAKRKLGISEAEESPKQSKLMKQLDMGPKGVLDEMNLSDDELAMPPPPPAKRAKRDVTPKELTKPTAPPLKISNGRQAKKWQKEGLYVGQDPKMDPTQKGGHKKLQKKQRPGSSGSVGTAASTEPDSKPDSQSSFMTLPMFSYLEKERNFTIPYDIYAPSAKKGNEKPKDWTKLNKNRLVGDAKEQWPSWEKGEKLPSSMCVCARPPAGDQGCGEDCLNRVMQYECNDDNCPLDGLECSNRAFAELAARTKKGGLFDTGVEVIKTDQRGFGIRSCRTFTPGQIIMEYTGELISEGECQRRMREDYKDKQCYYLMELEKGLIIDGTKGSMARFINHSCSPNCEVRMVRVNGTPRMAIFAGKDGVMTGEELTYDYNFDNFGATKQLCYCGAPNCRGTLSKRLNAAEQKKQNREETERKRKAAEELQKHADDEQRKKKIKTDRGSSWRGWVAVDDPETKERLRAEKREREDAEKNSSRAKRLASRRQSLPMPAAKEAPTKKKKGDAARRKTTQIEQQSIETETNDNAPTTDDTNKIANDTETAQEAPTSKKNGAARMKTTQMDQQSTEMETNENAPADDDTNKTSNDTESAQAGLSVITASSSRTTTHTRTFSTGSKFREELPRPTSAHTNTSTIVKRTEVSVSRTEIHEEAQLLNGDSNIFEGEDAPPKVADTAKSGLSRTASKGKEVMKSVGEAVRKSFKGFDKSEKGASGTGKLRQSTLTFAKLE